VEPTMSAVRVLGEGVNCVDGDVASVPVAMLLVMSAPSGMIQEAQVQSPWNACVK
jgi:hypothetical protein